MKAETQSNALGAVWFFRSIAVWGPGLLVMLADTDAGNVVTAAQSDLRLHPVYARSARGVNRPMRDFGLHPAHGPRSTTTRPKRNVL